MLIADADRAAYGEAIDTAMRFSAAIVGQAIGLLDGIGVESPGAVLASLVRSTVDNALSNATVHPPELSTVDALPVDALPNEPLPEEDH